MPLRRELGFWDSVAINVGIVIGVGIFRVPHEVAETIRSPFWILAAWGLGGLLTLAGVLCYAELSSLLPETGGTYIYLREAYGGLVGFLFGWMEFALARAASIAAMAYILTDYLGNFLPWAWEHEKAAAMGAVAFFSGINIFGLKVGRGIQDILSSLKVVFLIIMVAVVFALAGRLSVPPPESSDSLGGSWAGLAPAMIPILWTYGGWHQSTFMSAEFRDARGVLPASLMVGALIVTALYLAINAAYLAVLSPAEMTQAPAVASEVFRRLAGRPGQFAVSAVVLISASGALNSMILTGARIPFAVACDLPRFSWFAGIHSRFGTPVRSLLLNGFWASALVLLGNFDQLLFSSGFAVWLFFAMVGFSLFVLRRKAGGGRDRQFSVPGYPYVPLLFAFSSLGLCLVTVRHTPYESLAGALLVASGIPIYRLLRRRT